MVLGMVGLPACRDDSAPHETAPTATALVTPVPSQEVQPQPPNATPSSAHAPSPHLLGGVTVVPSAALKPRPPAPRPAAPATPPSLDSALRPKQWVLEVLLKQWLSKAQQGAPVHVVLDVRTTFGWGCPCPHFVHIDHSGPGNFLYPVMAQGVPDVTKWWMPGVFRIAGYFTGRRVGYSQWVIDTTGEPPERKEGRTEEPHPEFVVTRWCYERYRLSPNEDYLRESRNKMVREKVPFCRQPLRYTRPVVEQWPEVPRNAPCTREKVRLLRGGNPDALAEWDAAERGYQGDDDRPGKTIEVMLEEGASLQRVARRHGARIADGSDRYGNLAYRSKAAAVAAMAKLLCDHDVQSATMGRAQDDQD